MGELCRYLSVQQPCDEEVNNPIEKMVGNGLRPDVWDDFRHRFDVKESLKSTEQVKAMLCL